VPALATLALAARLPPPVALTGAAGLAMVAALRPGRTALTRAAPARARIPAPALGAPLFVAVGAAWAALVAAMSEAGFSGEARYLLPGAVPSPSAGRAACSSSVGCSPRVGAGGSSGP